MTVFGAFETMLYGKLFRVGLEQVGVECRADERQLVGVDGLFVEDFLKGARRDTDLLGEPGVGVALATQLFAYESTDM